MTALTFSLASSYAFEEFLRNQTVAATRTGSTLNKVSPSLTLISKRAMNTPMKVRPEFTIVMRPVWRNVDIASTSVVILVMIRPAISRS